MNPFNKTPSVNYFCVWAKKPRAKPRKGHKQVGFSDRYHFTGFIEVDQVRYRVQFVAYEDVYKLLGRAYPSKDTMVALYAAYAAGIGREEHALFSPVIADTGGRIGVPAVIHRDQFAWLPYVVMSVGDNGTMDVEFRAIEVEMDAVTDLMSLTTEVGGIIIRRGRTRRWVWVRYRAGAVDAVEEDVAA